MKTIAAVLAALLVVFIMTPLWLFLLYKILAHINATELMWFLYWCYVPAAVVVGLISGVLKWLAEE